MKNRIIVEEKLASAKKENGSRALQQMLEAAKKTGVKVTQYPVKLK